MFDRILVFDRILLGMGGDHGEGNGDRVGTGADSPGAAAAPAIAAAATATAAAAAGCRYGPLVWVDLRRVRSSSIELALGGAVFIDLHVFCVYRCGMSRTDGCDRAVSRTGEVH